MLTFRRAFVLAARKVNCFFAHAPIWGIWVSGLTVFGLVYWQSMWGWLDYSSKVTCAIGDFGLFLFGLFLSQKLSPPTSSHMESCSYTYDEKTAKSEHNSPTDIIKNKQYDANEDKEGSDAI
jgi:hypothetical protein